MDASANKLSTFARMQSYPRAPSVLANRDLSVAGNAKARCWSLMEILTEASRDPEACGHIESPQPAELLMGVNPMEVARLIDEDIARLESGGGRKIRRDQHVLMTVIYSYPLSWSEVSASDDSARLDEWIPQVLDSVTKDFGRRGGVMVSAVMHRDESHPHIHIYLLPRLVPGYQAKLLSPGELAIREAIAERPELRSRARSIYRKAMTEWHDQNWLEVGRRFGHERRGGANLGRKSRSVLQAEDRLNSLTTAATAAFEDERARHTTELAALAKEKERWIQEKAAQLAADEERKKQMERGRQATLQALLDMSAGDLFVRDGSWRTRKCSPREFAAMQVNLRAAIDFAGSKLAEIAEIFEGRVEANVARVASERVTPEMIEAAAGARVSTEMVARELGRQVEATLPAAVAGRVTEEMVSRELERRVAPLVPSAVQKRVTPEIIEAAACERVSPEMVSLALEKLVAALLPKAVATRVTEEMVSRELERKVAPLIAPAVQKKVTPEMIAVAAGAHVTPQMVAQVLAKEVEAALPAAVADRITDEMISDAVSARVDQRKIEIIADKSGAVIEAARLGNDFLKKWEIIRPTVAALDAATVDECLRHRDNFERARRRDLGPSFDRSRE